MELLEITLRGQPRSVPPMRGAVREVLAAERCTAQDDILLVVSELLTNAVIHTRSLTITLRLVLAGAHLRVEVFDDGSPRVPLPRTPSDEAEAGRGLRMVEHLAEKWGVSDLQGGAGRQVWALMAWSSDV